MKSFSAAFAIGMLAAANAQSNLKEKWEIGTPTVDYISLGVNLTFAVSDFILPGQAKYQMYTSGCKEQGTPLVNQTSGLVDMGLVDTDNLVREEGVSLNKKATIKISLDPTTLTKNTELYSENASSGSTNAQVVFCVRFGLHVEGASVEVNYLETEITLDIDRSNGFEIGSVAVGQKDKLVPATTQTYGVECYLCTDDEIEDNLVAVRKPGSEIRVCIRPNKEARADGMYMHSIDSFQWRREVPISFSQSAVRNGEPVLLTDLFCEPGELVCNLVSVLYSSFYATPGFAFGAGVASMQFGGDNTYIDLEDGLGGYQYKADGTRLTGVDFFKRRNLRKVQQVEAAATSEFELSVEVGPLQKAITSGASSIGTMVVSLVAAAGVLVML
ncbi:hypothetical protein IV203_020636 [Nitzschia inconspicua]|uniref:Uncharacterized protein n=1 Tax=Nitzschia inconspicua TaxID=303405 RepID=A0A9K3KFG1_9STRA|nr:hypothetical protein IV203_034433 [Nitzschia inconspicua]KAG7342692.1 hypothetical protein IV203_020636 [Nitzschia inconspicua]